MKSLVYIVCLLCAAHLLPAQDKPPELVSFSYRCLGLGREFRHMELYVGAGEGAARQQIYLNDLAKTNSYEYRGLPVLSFYAKATGGLPVAQARYNPEHDFPLLLFTKNPEGSATPCRVLPIEDSWQAHGVGTYQLVNLSSKALFWKVGAERFKIESNDLRVIEVDGTSAKTPVIALEVNKDGKPSRVYRAKWHNLKNMRRLIFVRDTNDNEVGSVRVQVVEDFLVPQVAE